MSITTFNVDEEALCAELRKKEYDLLLAARYGKTLLEENDLLKKDLENARQEHTNVIEVSTTDSYLCMQCTAGARSGSRMKDSSVQLAAVTDRRHGA